MGGGPGRGRCVVRIVAHEPQALCISGCGRATRRPTEEGEGGDGGCSALLQLQVEPAQTTEGDSAVKHTKQKTLRRQRTSGMDDIRAHSTAQRWARHKPARSQGASAREAQRDTPRSRAGKGAAWRRLGRTRELQAGPNNDRCDMHLSAVCVSHLRFVLSSPPSCPGDGASERAPRRQSCSGQPYTSPRPRWSLQESTVNSGFGLPVRENQSR